MRRGLVALAVIAPVLALSLWSAMTPQLKLARFSCTVSGTLGADLRSFDATKNCDYGALPETLKHDLVSAASYETPGGRRLLSDLIYQVLILKADGYMCHVEWRQKLLPWSKEDRLLRVISLRNCQPFVFQGKIVFLAPARSGRNFYLSVSGAIVYTSSFMKLPHVIFI